LRHWDGRAWTVAVPDVALNAVCGSAANDVYAVGPGGLLLHSNGSGWQQLDAGLSADFASVWVRGPGDVFVAGDNGLILRGDGTNWEQMAAGSFKKTARLRGHGELVIAYGESTFQWLRDGIWSKVPKKGSTSAAWIYAENDMYAIGAWGVEHWDGSDWTTVMRGETDPASRAFWGSPGKPLIGVGDFGSIIKGECSGIARFPGSGHVWNADGQNMEYRMKLSAIASVIGLLGREIMTD